MPAPSSLGTRTPEPTPPSSGESLDVVWIGEPQGIEKKLPAIAPNVRVSAQNADSALEFLQSGSADVVVIDATSAGVDAQGILARMKSAGIDLPVVLVTMNGTGRLASDANQLAVCDVVVKVPGFEQQLPAAFAEVRARHDLVALFRESRQGQDRLRAILEFQPAVVGVIGPDGILGAMNQAGLSLVGAAQEQVVGRSVTTFLPPEQSDELLNLVRRACKGEAGALDHSILRADGTSVDVRTQAVPFQNNQGGVALVTIEKRSGAAAAELASLTGRCDALTVALEEARAHLDKLRAERTSESARADALASELAESAATLALERERSHHQFAEAGTSNAEALSSLTQRCDALTASLGEATAQLDEVRTGRDRESARADALTSELAESVAALKQERDKSQRMLAETGATNAEALSSLTGQCDALTVSLSETTAQLNGVRTERARESARVEALTSELAEAEASLNHERERSQRLLAEMGAANAEALSSLTGRYDALKVSLGEATARLDAVSTERAGESARADALASELAGSVARVEALTSELTGSTARVDTLSAELTEAAATLNLERERARQLAEMATTNANELTSVKEQCDAAAAGLREANSQLDEVRSDVARVSARADALSSELAESVSALSLEREKSGRLLIELAVAKEMIEQSSKLQALLEADRDAMTALREHLRRFTSDTDRLCSEMIERHEATVDQADKVPA